PDASLLDRLHPDRRPHRAARRAASERADERLAARGNRSARAPAWAVRRMLLSRRRTRSTAGARRHGDGRCAAARRAPHRRSPRTSRRDLAVSWQPATVRDLPALGARDVERHDAQLTLICELALGASERARQPRSLAIRARATRSGRVFSLPEAR